VPHDNVLASDAESAGVANANGNDAAKAFAMGYFSTTEEL
jgi:hypothetical protein